MLQRQEVNLLSFLFPCDYSTLLLGSSVTYPGILKDEKDKGPSRCHAALHEIRTHSEIKSLEGHSLIITTHRPGHLLL